MRKHSPWLLAVAALVVVAFSLVSQSQEAQHFAPPMAGTAISAGTFTVRVKLGGTTVASAVVTSGNNLGVSRVGGFYVILASTGTSNSCCSVRASWIDWSRYSRPTAEPMPATSAAPSVMSSRRGRFGW